MSACEIRGGDSGILRKIGDLWVRWEVDALSIWVQVSVALARTSGVLFESCESRVVGFGRSG